MPISSVVLSSQRIDQKNAIYDAAKAKDREKEEAVNPLVAGGKKLVPSVTRVFSANRALYIYLQAYKPSTTLAASPTAVTADGPPLIAFVSLYTGDEQVFRTTPIAVVPNASTRLGITPLSFDVSLSSLAPGQYQCQVTILDPTSSKATFWRAPIVITQ